MLAAPLAPRTWSGMPMDALFQDVRYSWRTLRQSPVFTTVAVLTLALGIGANAAIFQLIDAVRLRVLPVRDPDELLEIDLDHQGWFAGHLEGRYPILTNPLFEQIRENQHAFSGVFAWGTDLFNLSRGGEARFAQGLWVSGEYFNVLEARPHLGRLLGPADDRKGCPAVAVISHAFWQREFGGSPSAVGNRLSLNGTPVEVLGVTQEDFFGVEVGRRFDVAVPLCSEPGIKGEHSNLQVPNSWWLGSMGRLKPGWTAKQASADLEALSPAAFAATLPSVYQKELADHYLKFTLRALPAGTGISALREEYESPLLLLLATTGVVLLIACANLANLLLARASGRQREIAVRRALGASRGRLVRQLLTESLLLVVAGASLGLLLAQWLGQVLVALISTRANPLFVALGVDLRVIGFTAGVAVLTCAFFGLIPALRAGRTSVAVILKSGGRAQTEGPESFGLRRVLVASQLALSLVLLLGALLFSRTLGNLMTLDAGFRQDGILIANVDLTRLHLPVERRQAFKADLARQMVSLTGVESAAEAVLLPWGDYSNNVMRGEGPQDKAPMFQANLNQIAPGYFKTLQIPLLAGRDFDSRDTTTSPGVAIVNEAFARRLSGPVRADWQSLWREPITAEKPATNPVGSRFLMQSFGDVAPVPFEIVGLVKDTKYDDLRADIKPLAFFPRAQEREPDAFGEIVVRSSAPLSGLATAMRGRFAQTSPEIGVEFRVLKSEIRESLLRERLMATLCGFFGFLAALLATIGIYGVISYSVGRRTNEIGVRMALGADPRQILRMIMSEVFLLLGIGVAVGTGLGIAAARAASALLFGLKRTTRGRSWQPSPCSVSLPLPPAICRHGAPRESTRWSRCAASDQEESFAPAYGVNTPYRRPGFPMTITPSQTERDKQGGSAWGPSYRQRSSVSWPLSGSSFSAPLPSPRRAG